MIKLKIVTPEGISYDSSEVVSVTLPTTSGVITVLEDHIPLVSVLQAGEVVVRKGEHNIELAVSSGVVHVVENSEVHIMADTAERAEEIDLERAESARKRAEAFLKEKESAQDVDFAALQAKINKELARINVARRARRRISRNV